jgi:hypothetical protein
MFTEIFVSDISPKYFTYLVMSRTALKNEVDPKLIRTLDKIDISHQLNMFSEIKFLIEN